MRLSIKPSVYLAVAAAIATAAAVVPVSLQTAGALAAACGSACMSPQAQLLGTTEVLTVSGSSAGTVSQIEDKDFYNGEGLRAASALEPTIVENNASREVSSVSAATNLRRVGTTLSATRLR